MAWLFEVRVCLLHSVYFVRTRQAPLRESNSYKRATSERCWKLQQTVCGCVYARNCALPSLGQRGRLLRGPRIALWTGQRERPRPEEQQESAFLRWNRHKSSRETVQALLGSCYPSHSTGTSNSRGFHQRKRSKWSAHIWLSRSAKFQRLAVHGRAAPANDRSMDKHHLVREPRSADWTASCQVGEQVINGVRRIMEVIVENALL